MNNTPHTHHPYLPAAAPKTRSVASGAARARRGGARAHAHAHARPHIPHPRNQKVVPSSHHAFARPAASCCVPLGMPSEPRSQPAKPDSSSGHVPSQSQTQDCTGQLATPDSMPELHVSSHHWSPNDSTTARHFTLVLSDTNSQSVISGSVGWTIEWPSSPGGFPWSWSMTASTPR